LLGESCLGDKPGEETRIHADPLQPRRFLGSPTEVSEAKPNKTGKAQQRAHGTQVVEEPERGKPDFRFDEGIEGRIVMGIGHTSRRET
jgi:hypothetical protein